MAVTVKIPTQLREPPAAPRRVQAEGETVGEALESRVRGARRAARPPVRRDGDLRRFVNVYLGGEDIRFLDGLQTAVPAGGELTILPAVAGG